MIDHLTKTKWLQNQLHGTFYMLQFYATTPMHVTFHVGSCAPEQGILANYRHCRGFSDQKPRSVAKAMAKSRSWCWFLKGTPHASYGIGAAFPQITWHKKTVIYKVCTDMVRTSDFVNQNHSKILLSKSLYHSRLHIVSFYLVSKKIKNILGFIL